MFSMGRVLGLITNYMSTPSLHYTHTHLIQMQGPAPLEPRFKLPVFKLFPSRLANRLQMDCQMGFIWSTECFKGKKETNRNLIILGGGGGPILPWPLTNSRHSLCVLPPVNQGIYLKAGLHTATPPRPPFFQPSRVP